MSSFDVAAPTYTWLPPGEAIVTGVRVITPNRGDSAECPRAQRAPPAPWLSFPRSSRATRCRGEDRTWRRTAGTGRTPRGGPSSTLRQGGQPGRPDREPQHPVGPRPAEHLEHPAGSNWPSTTKPVAIIPHTGSTKNTASTSTGPRARPTGASSRRASSRHRLVTSLHSRQPLVAVLGDGRRVDGVGVRRAASRTSPSPAAGWRRRRPGRRTSPRAARPGTAGSA